MQKPLPHWLSPPHETPASFFGSHTPAEHQLPLAQSASVWQSPMHASPPHTYGAHACVCTAGQLPWPSHDASSVATPALHAAARQVR